MGDLLRPGRAVGPARLHGTGPSRRLARRPVHRPPGTIIPGLTRVNPGRRAGRPKDLKNVAARMIQAVLHEPQIDGVNQGTAQIAAKISFKGRWNVCEQRSRCLFHRVWLRAGATTKTVVFVVATL